MIVQEYLLEVLYKKEEKCLLDHILDVVLTRDLSA